MFDKKYYTIEYLATNPWTDIFCQLICVEKALSKFCDEFFFVEDFFRNIIFRNYEQIIFVEYIVSNKMRCSIVFIDFRKNSLWSNILFRNLFFEYFVLNLDQFFFSKFFVESFVSNSPFWIVKYFLSNYFVLLFGFLSNILYQIFCIKYFYQIFIFEYFLTNFFVEQFVSKGSYQKFCGKFWDEYSMPNFFSYILWRIFFVDVFVISLCRKVFIDILWWVLRRIFLVFFS